MSGGRPEEESTELDFACRPGQLIAIFADETEKVMRFWLAESQSDISKPGNEDEEFPIFYYKATDSNATSYKLEKGRRTVQLVKYDQCLGTVTASSREKNSFQITPLERDRVQAIAKKEDLKIAAECASEDY